MTGAQHTSVSLFLQLTEYLRIRVMGQQKVDWGIALLQIASDEKLKIPEGFLNAIGAAFDEVGNYQKAIYYYGLLVPMHEEADENHPSLGILYCNLGVSYWRLGELEMAEDYLKRSLKIQQLHGKLSGAARSLMNLANIYYQRWEMAEALPFAQEAVQVAHQTEDAYLQAQLTSSLAFHMVGSLQFDEAAPVYEEAIRLLEKIGDEIGLAQAKFNYALLCNLLKDIPKARQLAKESLLVFQHYQMPDAQKVRTQLAKWSGG